MIEILKGHAVFKIYDSHISFKKNGFNIIFYEIYVIY